MTGLLYIALANLNQAGLELRDPPGFASPMLGLKAWAATRPRVAWDCVQVCSGDDDIWNKCR